VTWLRSPFLQSIGCEMLGFVDKKVMRYDDANSWHYMQVAGIADFFLLL